MSKQYWILSVSDNHGKNRKVCTAAWGDGSSTNKMMLEFTEGARGIPFDSEKQAWWHWYQFRKYHPDLAAGHYAKVTPYNQKEELPD